MNFPGYLSLSYHTVRNMNYEKIYNSLIQSRKSRGLDKSKLEGYYERHHIVPRSMGGSNEDNNLVLLTGREHYVAHLLLTKFKTGQDYYKCQHALGAMTTHSANRKLTAAQFEKCREAVGKAQDRLIAEGRHNFIVSAEPKDKKRDRRVKFDQSELNPAKSEKNRKAQSERAKVRKTCEHCGADGTLGTYAQSHGSNCPSLISNVLATNMSTGEIRLFKTKVLAEAALNLSNVDKVLRGERKHAGGWHFGCVLPHRTGV